VFALDALEGYHQPILRSPSTNTVFPNQIGRYLKKRLQSRFTRGRPSDERGVVLAGSPRPPVP